MSPIEIRRIDHEEIGYETIAELIRIILPKATHASAEFVRWSYAANPSGESISVGAFDQGRMVAHFSGQALQATIDGQLERGVLYHHAITLPAYERRGIFTEMALVVREHAREAGYQFLLAFPNQFSLKGVTQTEVAMQLVGQLDAKIGMGNLPASDPAAPVRFEVQWPSASLTWRLARPSARYSVRRTKSNRVQIFGDSGSMGVQAMLAELPARQLESPLPDLRTSNPLRLWMGLDPSRNWKRHLYFDIPLRLRPAPLNLCYKDLTGRGRVLDRQTTRISALDFDAI